MSSFPRRFERRVTVGVVAVFLVTMAVFLAAAYRAERARYLAEAFQNLEETVAVLPQLSGSPGEMTDLLRDLENRLDRSADVAHRLLVVSGADEILVSPRPEEVGADWRTLYGPVAAGSEGGARATATRGGEGWLFVSQPLGETAERVVLMRSRQGLIDFLGSFLILHGLHAGVTVLLFAALLTFLGTRLVRRPIVELAEYVGRVEAGQLRTPPSWNRDDEFGWLAERFAEMGERLDAAVRRLVRREKAASAVAVAYRVVRQLAEPLARLQRHILLLESAAAQDPELEELAADIESDRDRLVEALLRLEELLPEEETPEPGRSIGVDEPEKGSDIASSDVTSSRGETGR